jgi:hypothetical protein
MCKRVKKQIHSFKTKVAVQSSAFLVSGASRIVKDEQMNK